MVVVQEIFGVNAHIKEVADWFAAAGRIAGAGLCLCPAIIGKVDLK